MIKPKRLNGWSNLNNEKMEIRRENYFENEFIKIWLEDDIIFLEYAPNVVITLDIAIKIVKERLKISSGTTRPMVSDARKAATMDKDARGYFSEGDSIKYVSAGAILINNKLHQFIGNIFLKVNKPPIPAKLFTSKESALKWLERYKNLN